MTAYVAEWLNLLVRWLHVVTGIAWIGSSFYFIWLDNHLLEPESAEDRAKGVGGELWSVHGGGFYHAQKFRLGPPKLPGTLHWFKWEAYSTWMSGMFLLALMYWWGAEVYLIDPAVADLGRAEAVAIAIAVLAGSWFVYDGLCRSPLGQRETVLAGVLFVLTALLAWGLCELYGGRGAFIHYGAVLGTIMAANVFFVIIPGQRRMVLAFTRGEAPDATDGERGKQRSVHNTYFTLPVLFVMTSNHYAMTFAGDRNWVVLVAFTLAGALIRVYFVARHRGRASPLPILVASLILLAVAFAIVPKSRATSARAVTLEDVVPVIERRCAVCHSATPSHVAFPAPPAGVTFDSREQVRAEAGRIYQQTVVLKVMPVGNLTGMSEDERDLIDAWYRGTGETQ